MADEIESRMQEIRERLRRYKQLSVQVLEADLFMDDDEYTLYDKSATDIDWLLTQLAASRQECEQLRVQLAGCSVAALGIGEQAERGTYGWSQSYEDVRQLRQECERLREDKAQVGKLLFDALYDIEHGAYLEDLHKALAHLRELRVATPDAPPPDPEGAVSRR